MYMKLSEIIVLEKLSLDTGKTDKKELFVFNNNAKIKSLETYTENDFYCFVSKNLYRRRNTRLYRAP